MTVDLGNEVPTSPDDIDRPPLADDRLNQMWVDRSQAMQDTLGLALSGGGYRATLLSLGVLTFLVDSGLNQEVRTIASVSGGSYTNAFLASMDTPFHAIGPGDEKRFNDAVCGFLKRLTTTNVWLKPRVIGVGLAAAGMLGLTFVLGRKPRRPMARVALRIAGVLGTLWVLDYRGWALTREIWNTILDGEDPKMAQLHRVDGGRPLDHVVCATNIADGKFVYMSGRFLYASDLGWHTEVKPLDHLRPATGLWRRWRQWLTKKRWKDLGNFKDIPMKRAVDASAALPIVIPPRPFPTGVFERAGMWFVPPELRLVDGGVYDNLAVQWFRSADAMRSNALLGMRRDEARPGYVDGLDVDAYMDEMAPEWVFKPDLLLVVNAGGELKWTRNLPFTTLPILREPIPVLTETMELFRTAKIAFTAGTERRLYWLRREFRDRFERENPRGGGRVARTAGYHPVEGWRGTIVQIDHTPYSVPKALRDYPSPDVRDRARLARRILGRLGQDWPERKHQNSKVPAYPHKMDFDDVVSLMYQGYVSTWANLYTLWDKGLDTKPPIDFTEFKKRFECAMPK